ncbi:hypothetical protein C9374_012094 [Naegleria lovaniensis]|uniref:RanBP2-type domain-containing protein n=1 Tax=Naegleria lovaniensis TaxID=51637 RepID=A0AA88G8S5_NAELO|nr:uncharacterized protein C9374_012094 [Naegleria lovaniensis]KAG2373487.1 hypothetical protein C9374_012094 [Naegleria lovaniensis]
MTHSRSNNKRGGGGTNNYSSSSSSTTTSTQRFSSHHHHDYSKAPPTILKNQNRVDRANSSGSSSSNSIYRSSSSNVSSSSGGSFHPSRSTAAATTYSSHTPSYRSQNEEEEEDYEEEDFNQDDEDDNEEDNTYEERKKFSSIPSGSSNQRPSQFQSQHVASSNTTTSSSSSQYYGSSPTNNSHQNLSSASHVSSPRSSNVSRPTSHGSGGSSSYSRNTTTSNRYHSTHYNPSSTNLMNVKYHSENISHLKSGLDPITQVLLSKKPLHHIIVLFAADLRVRNYAQQVQETFLAKGINVYTQLACYTRDTPTSSEDYEFIKPDHLQELITNSIADYVAVIGDRNMKHRTCQAKKNGKLVEVSVDERAEEILQDWESSSPHSDFPILDSISNMRDISDISTEQVYELIEAFANIRHIKDRVDRLRKSISELRDWKSPKSQKSIQTIMDEKMLSKLTTCNNAAIKLHKDLISALEYIQDLPCNSESSCISVLDPEDERGVSLNSKHLTFSGDDNSEAQTSSGDDELVIAISSSLKDLLIEKCNEIIPTIEKLGDQMSEIAGSSSLWNAYIKEHHEEQEKMKQRKLQQQALKSSSSSISTTPPTHLHIPINTASNVNRKRNNSTSSTSSSGSISSSGSSSTNPQNGWNCPECTYLNKASLTRCKMCNNPKPSEPEWIDASSQKKPAVVVAKSKAQTGTTTAPSKTTKKGQTNISVTVPKASPATSTSSTLSSGSSSSSSTTGQKVIVAASSSNTTSPVIVTPTTATSTTPSSNIMSTNPSPIPSQANTKAWQTSSTPVTPSSNIGLLGSNNNTLVPNQPQQLPSQFFPNMPFPNGSQPTGGILVGPFGGAFVPAMQYPGSMMVGLGLMPPNGSSFPMGPPSTLNQPPHPPQTVNPTYDQEYPSLDQLHSKGGKKATGSNTSIPTNATSSTLGSNISNIPVDLLVGNTFSSNSRGASPLVMNSPKVKDSRSNFGFPSSPISNQSGDSSSVTSQQFSQIHLFENSNVLNQNVMPSSRGFSWDALLSGGTSTNSFGNMIPNSSNSGVNGQQSQLLAFSGASYGSSHNQEVATSITDSLLSEERSPSPQQKPSNFPASLLTSSTLPSNQSSSLNFTSLSCFNSTGDSMWSNSALSNSSWGSSTNDFSSSSSFATSTNPSGAFATSGGLGLTSFLPSGNTGNVTGSSIGGSKSAFSPFGESSAMSNSSSSSTQTLKNAPPASSGTTAGTTQTSTRRIPVNQPCIVCGQESLFECTICASLRRKGAQLAPTYFCSTEHQQLAWKDHQQKCHNVTPQSQDTSHLTQTPSPFGIKYY